MATAFLLSDFGKALLPRIAVLDAVAPAFLPLSSRQAVSSLVEVFDPVAVGWLGRGSERHHEGQDQPCQIDSHTLGEWEFLNHYARTFYPRA
jgi:hypothetical protein